MRVVLALILLLAADLAIAEDIAGPARVTSGDTFEIGGRRLRLYGIDAPDGGHVCAGPQREPFPCGLAATRVLQQAIGDREVRCVARSEDRRGRTIAVCFAGKTELNLAMVREGWAIAFPQSGAEEIYRTAEEEARRGKRGLWADGYQRPKDWRVSEGGG